MGDKKKTRLRNPDIKKVDLVDDGANPGAKIMLYKSKAAPGAPAGVQPPKGWRHDESARCGSPHP